MDIIRFYDDYNIEYATEGLKQCRDGWANIECPFCVGNPGPHLGFNIEDNYFVCWRCGWKSNVTVISKLLKVSYDDAKLIEARYGGSASVLDKTTRQAKVGTLSYKILGEECQKAHRSYLKQRNYSPKQLINDFHLRGTGPVSIMDGLNFARRIVVPIFWEGREVSFISRDITQRHALRYIVCPEEREQIKHKHILFAHPDTFQRDTCILVEGVFDVFRFGVGAVATLGIKYTREQVRLISTLFKKVWVMYDSDPQAIISAQKLSSELLFRGVYSKSIEIENDPGDMTQEVADNYKLELLGEEY